MSDLHKEFQEPDSGEADSGTVRSSGRGQDKAARHQVSTGIQRTEWSGKFTIRYIIALEFLTLSA